MSLYSSLAALMGRALASLDAGEEQTAKTLLDEVQARCCGGGELSLPEREELKQLHRRCVAAATSLHALIERDLARLRVGAAASRVYSRR